MRKESFTVALTHRKDGDVDVCVVGMAAGQQGLTARFSGGDEYGMLGFIGAASGLLDPRDLDSEDAA